MTSLTELNSWQALQKHQLKIRQENMQAWFKNDPDRFQRFSIEQQGILLDYSKNLILPETMDLLFKLAQEVKLQDKVNALFSGAPVNNTENRPALHTALRRRLNTPLRVNGTDITEKVNQSLQHMKEFSEKIRQHKLCGATGKPFRDIVNIGIGGSNAGPMLAVSALTHYKQSDLTCHFISNVDQEHLNEVLNSIDPERSLFLISSKSFTTIETLTNAKTIKNWLMEKLKTQSVSQHFAAVTAAPDKAIQFGIDRQQIFTLWDWVGGRYSVWSAIGLPLALMIGMENFEEFLAGAFEMDQHFQQAEFSRNMPVILGLLGVWYINFFGAESSAILTYSHLLQHLRSYLQQADMESNGKSVNFAGESINYQTGPIIWGDQGCNGQHAYHQLLHQGTHLVPIDFIVTGNEQPNNHHQILMASALSQAQALMQGKTKEQACQELIKAGHSDERAAFLASHLAMPGNHPSNVIFLKQLSPRTLGSLLALYEHKIFVQSVVWDINAYDQWGVELGKQLLPAILQDLQSETTAHQHDSSTAGLIKYYKRLQKLTLKV